MVKSLFAAVALGCVAGAAAWAADESEPTLPYPPTAVEVVSFFADKVICDEGEPVLFQCVLRLSNATPSMAPSMNPVCAPPFRLEVWDESGVGPAAKVAETKVEAKDLKERVEAGLGWQPPAGSSYGHLARLRVLDNGGRLLAEQTTVYEICRDWQYIVRLGSSSGHNLACESLTDADLERIVDFARRGGINTLELYCPMPDYYNMAPDEPTWQSYPGTGPRVSGERIKRLGELLHARGMRMITYNETSAVNPNILKGEDPETYKVYNRDSGKLQLTAMYYGDRGCFTPNCLKIADRFARSMAESVRRYGWDGVLTDSATADFYYTAHGYDAKGNALTSLTPGQVGERYFAPLRAAVLPINPKFRIFCQNIAASMLLRSYHWKQPDDKIDAVTGDYMRKEYGDLFKSVDAWSGELDPHFTPQKNYPQTYDKYTLMMNIGREVSGKPILQWTLASGTPWPGEYSAEFARPFLDVVAADRCMWNEHFSNYGGCWGPWSNAPVNKVQVQLQHFVARFGQYLRAPELRWVRHPEESLSVDSARELFWTRTVYQRDCPDGAKEWTVNLINLDSPTIRPQNLGEPLHGTPPPAFPVTVSFNVPAGAAAGPVRAFVMDAEDEALKVLEVPAKIEGSKAVIAIPPVCSWQMLVIRQGTAKAATGAAPTGQGR